MGKQVTQTAAGDTSGKLRIAAYSAGCALSAALCRIAQARTDVTEAVWAPLDALEPFALWSEAHRVIGIARRMLRFDGHPAATKNRGWCNDIVRAHRRRGGCCPRR